MKKKLRIAMFFSNNVAIPDGLVYHVYYLSHELRKLGHSVYLYGSHNKTLFPLKKFEKIVDTIKIPLFKETIMYWTKKSKKYDEPVKKIENKEFDLLHIHDPYLPFVSYEILEKTRLPIISTFHTAWDKNSFFNVINDLLPLFKDLFKNIKGSIFVSKMSKKIFSFLLPKRSSKIVIHNGIDPKLFYPKPTQAKNIRLLFVARIIPRKGLLFILRAMTVLTKEIKSIRLTVMGKGPQLAECKQFVKKHKLTKFVEFKGYVSGRKKIKIYQNSDIFCAPYRNEAFAVTLIEAMACEIPIVGFDSDGVKEALVGYPFPELITPYRNVKLLTKALEKLILDTKMRNKIKNWLSKKRKSLSWSRIALQTEDFYYKVLKV